MEEKEAAIIEELTAVQGPPMDIGGYFYTDEANAAAAMRPSPTCNAILDSFLATE